MEKESKRTEQEIMKGNIKLNVFDSFPYDDLKKVIRRNHAN